jgi:hypothetical protein
VGAIHIVAIPLDSCDAGGVVYRHRRRSRTIGRAAELYRAEGQPAEAARVLTDIAVIHGAVGRPDSALAYFRAAVALAREVGDRRGEAAAALAPPGRA